MSNLLTIGPLTFTRDSLGDVMATIAVGDESRSIMLRDTELIALHRLTEDER